jgi:hypothetical protein
VPARPPECSDATALARSAVPSSDEEISRQIIRGTLQRNYFFQARDSDFERGIKKVVANNWITIDLRNGTAINWLELLRELVPKASVFAITELIAKSIVNCFCYRA